MVTRQHLARAVERIIILRISTPREIGNRLQIGVQHVDIGRAGRHVFQTLQIFINLFAHGGLEVDLVQLLAQFGHIRQICAALYRQSDELGHLCAKAGVDAPYLGYKGIYFFLSEIVLGDVIGVPVRYPLPGSSQNLSVQCHYLTVFNLFVY